MKYKKLIKTNLTKIGYSIMNLETGKCIITPQKNALIVRHKVNDFDYYKGFTAIEVAFEEIIEVMVKFNGLYAYDKETLQTFLKELENFFIHNEINYNSTNFDYLKYEKIFEENELIVLSFGSFFDEINNN